MYNTYCVYAEKVNLDRKKCIRTVLRDSRTLEDARPFTIYRSIDRDLKFILNTIILELSPVLVHKLHWKAHTISNLILVKYSKFTYAFSYPKLFTRHRRGAG